MRVHEREWDVGWWPRWVGGWCERFGNGLSHRKWRWGFRRTWRVGGWTMTVGMPLYSIPTALIRDLCISPYSPNTHHLSFWHVCTFPPHPPDTSPSYHRACGLPALPSSASYQPPDSMASWSHWLVDLTNRLDHPILCHIFLYSGGMPHSIILEDNHVATCSLEGLGMWSMGVILFRKPCHSHNG